METRNTVVSNVSTSQEDDDIIFLGVFPFFHPSNRITQWQTRFSGKHSEAWHWKSLNLVKASMQLIVVKLFANNIRDISRMSQELFVEPKRKSINGSQKWSSKTYPVNERWTHFFSKLLIPHGYFIFSIKARYLKENWFDFRQSLDEW